MTVSDILLLEEKNIDSINLIKEGIFWRAYNRSAMRMYEHLHAYKVIVKYVKKVQQEIYYCGFPESSLDNIREKAIEKGFQITEIKDKKIIISGVSATEDYKNWMENQQVINEPKVQYMNTDLTGFENLSGLISQIQQYPLENATPLETMLFVQKLKQSIKNGSV